MSKPLPQIVQDLLDNHGTDGAIAHIKTSSWKHDTKEEAPAMIEKRSLDTALVEPGEYNRDEFFQ